MSQENKQEDITGTRLRRRARLVKQEHKANQRTELTRRAKLSNSPKFVATLKAINRYKKLIFYTEDEQSMDLLYKIDASYDELGDCKKALWVDDKLPGVWLKLSLPVFMHDALFKYEAMKNKTVDVVFHSKSYDSAEYGKGYYFTLACDLKLHDTEE